MTDPRQALPAVHQLLADAEREGIGRGAPPAVVTACVRDLLSEARARGGTPPATGWMDALARRVAEATRPSLVPVVNATGVILHTNLGRAPLPRAALEAVERVGRYSTLEYELDAGERGSRQTHVTPLVRDLTGSEAALVTNNAASALMLVLNSLASGGEAIVSRSELVEIGGAFRIPDILARSGCVLVEVGTTNRTRLRDYVAALSPRTRCVLKVHRSNFSLSGFTAEVGLEALRQVAEPRGVPVLHDVGSGLLLDLEAHGLRGEPLVRDSVAGGAIVVFSGDKLVGGPQAGIIAGPRRWVSDIAANPLARALRPDKIVLAALEATLALYRDPASARREIPTLAMLTADPDDLRRRGEALAARIDGAAVRAGNSSVGGGAFPGCPLPTTLVSVPTEHPDRMLERLRAGEPPVIARADEGVVLFDPRTVAPEEEEPLVRAVSAVLAAS